MRKLLVAATVVVLVMSCTVVRADKFHWTANGHFYEPVHTPTGISWTDANVAAVASGGYLATLTSAAENEFVFGLIAGAPDLWDHHHAETNLHGPWLGGYQIPGSPEPDGGWTWVTGEPWVFTNWAAGGGFQEPDDYLGNQQYVEYFRIAGAMEPTWNDEHNVNSDPPSPGYIVEYIPEPATLALLAAGLGTLVVRKRRT